MTAYPMQSAARQHFLALGLSALVTAGVLSGLLGLAGNDSSAQLAQQRLHRSQAAAVVPVAFVASPA